MKTCPNCRHPVPEDKRLCPNCGADVPAVWPPPPAGRPPGPTMAAARIRQEANSGVSMGCLGEFTLLFIAVVLFLVGGRYHAFQLFSGLPNGVQLFLAQAFLFGLPIAGAAVAYVQNRAARPYFARGLGYSIIIGAALSLGLVAMCGPRYY